MSSLGREPLAIDYMPWAGLKEEVTVGPVTFWPFLAKAEEKISDQQVRDELTQFFAIFVDNVGRPVQTVVVASCGAIEFRRFSAEESASIRAAADCLVFAAIATGTRSAVCSDNNSMAPPSSDRYDLCGRWVWPSHNGLVVQTDNSTCFWSFGKYIITEPVSLGGAFVLRYDELLNGLSRMFASEFPADLRQRLLRALEWFRFAHTESTAVSWLHKVVMMTTAFEILLDFPEQQKSLFFAQQIEAGLRLSESFLAKRLDAKGKEHEACLAAWWAKDFYDLRSRIIHGDQVDGNDGVYARWVTHLIVADLVLLELVQRILYQHHCIGDEVRQRAAALSRHSNEPPQAIEAQILPRFLGLNFMDVHAAIGWVPAFDERRKKLGE